MLRIAVLASLVAGCYQPSADAACSARCTEPGPNGCPGSQVCGADLRCKGESSALDCTLDPNIPDAGPTADAQTCFGNQLMEFGPLCNLTYTTTSSVVVPAEVNTTSNGVCKLFSQHDGTHDQVCVIFADDITVSSSVRAVGSHPLVLIATHDLTVSEILDASSFTTSDTPGAGFNFYMCPQPPIVTDGNGGGAGGCNQAQGGMGGAGDTPGGSAATLHEGAGLLHGGCAGQPSGDGIGGGPGGGALYLIAGHAVTIDAIVRAGGGGGQGAGNGQGGGGGGAGGMIVVEAQKITITSQGAVLADGGGGGSGGIGNLTGFPGDPGGLVLDASSGGPASGGASYPNDLSGFGGKGSYRVQQMGLPGGQQKKRGATGEPIGGGGGGGGAGFVYLFGAITNMGTVSPEPITL